MEACLSTAAANPGHAARAESLAAADRERTVSVSAIQADEFERAQRIAHGQADASDLQWLSKGFSAFLTGCGAVPLERCLHLPRKDSAMRRACRNYWLRRAWETLGIQLSPWRRSEKLAAAVRDFDARCWRRWRTLEEPPEGGGELEFALFQAFRSHDRVPFTAMQLHNIACGCG